MSKRLMMVNQQHKSYSENKYYRKCLDVLMLNIPKYKNGEGK